MAQGPPSFKAPPPLPPAPSSMDVEMVTFSYRHEGRPLGLLSLGARTYVNYMAPWPEHISPWSCSDWQGSWDICYCSPLNCPFPIALLRVKFRYLGDNSPFNTVHIFYEREPNIWKDIMYPVEMTLVYGTLPQPICGTMALPATSSSYGPVPPVPFLRTGPF